MTGRQESTLLLVGLTILTIAGYYQVHSHHFVWDTIPFVLENPWIHEWSVDNVVSMFTEAHRANWHPMVLLSHALDISLFGYDSGAHHLVNLALHILNSGLIFWLVLKIMTETPVSARYARWVSGLTALIFALHPQHVESVAWVVERKDVLYACFALGCLGSYLAFRDASGWRTFVPFVLFCCAIGAKPMAVTLPVVLIMLDVFPLNRAQSFGTLVTSTLRKTHYFVVSLIVALVTLSTQSMAMPDLQNLPQWARTLNAIDNSLFYLEHYLWPVNLSPFYPYPENAQYLKSPAFWLPGALFLTISGAVSAWLYFIKGKAWPGLLLGFYLVTLLPVSGLIHVGPAKATDHYVYLATVPFSLLTALAICTLWNRLPAVRTVTGTFAAAYIVFLLAITHQQVTYWNNTISLWSRVVQLHPESPFGHRNLAAGYVEIGEWDAALYHAELSLQLGSPDIDYVKNLRTEVMRQKATDIDG